jgi:hypothetical protein
MSFQLEKPTENRWKIVFEVKTKDFLPSSLIVWCWSIQKNIEFNVKLIIIKLLVNFPKALGVLK